MKGHDRGPEPSTLPLCPQCGGLITPNPGLLQARHDVQHCEWELDHLPISGATLSRRLIVAYRRLMAEHETVRDRLNARICDLEEDLASAQWDLKTAYELVDDLKADLNTAVGRHPAGGEL